MADASPTAPSYSLTRAAVMRQGNSTNLDRFRGDNDDDWGFMGRRLFGHFAPRFRGDIADMINA